MSDHASRSDASPDAPSRSNLAIARTERYSARNYHPLPIVISEAEGAWVTDPEGNRYLDMLSAYSALNAGHRHPRIIAALKAQADLVTLTSRAFHSEPFADLCEQLAVYTGKPLALIMNSGAEAVETALKAARRWAYRVKGVPDGTAEIIVCDGNFHGRTITVTSFSATPEYQAHFGPFTPGFKLVPYGDAGAIERAIGPNTAAVLIEPIQGESGIVIPPDGYLRAVRDVCTRERTLLIADEIQTGFGRTGRRFACDHEDVEPDLIVLGKALGGGVLPVSAVVGGPDTLGLFEPGSHGSTFGGNPLACAVALAALAVTEEDRLAERSRSLGAYMLERLSAIAHPDIAQVRGRGLFIGLELRVPARPYCERLMALGLLCKETHEHTIRFAPPLTVSREDLALAIAKVEQVFAANADAADDGEPA
ncbi:ornithine--oxo-acid transaminase [Paenibacillus methanolicus]|uniref:ornithine aminotransferase n=1 Tax=Paenibacillus methanolicus TaxID=582686 RepID=A0A5S5CC49_9BACL|nr:ornithine--oxo-acid transaminase [Paenibacillus methanolicus]TYP75573.1 ornithine--oxo-acid transaminase [Paenibacillus methanolicus]